MIKILSPKFHEFFTCSNFPTTKFFLRFELKTTRCISCNSHNYRFLSNQFKLNVDNFTVKTWTNSFKFELLSVILLHTMLEFDLLFSFTKENWTFESFQLTVYEILRGGKFKLSTKSSPKNKQSMNWKMVRIFSERNR